MNYINQTVTLPLYIVKGKGPKLFGRNWLERIEVAWAELNTINSHSAVNVDCILQKYPMVFTDQIGTLKGTKAKKDQN